MIKIDPGKLVPAELIPSEREEMIRLRAENERLRAEIAVVKKEIALREERCAAQLKAKKLCSSKNCAMILSISVDR